MVGLNLLGTGLLLMMMFAIGTTIGDQFKSKSITNVCELGFLASVVLVLIGAGTLMVEVFL